MRLINIKSATVAYDKNIALDSVNLEVLSGDYICVIGDNGSGKSTLIKAIVGLVPLKKGSISFESGLARKEIGYLPQQSLIQRDFPASVWEVVLSGCLSRTGKFPFYKAEHKERANQVISSLSLTELKSKAYKELSGGQQQRVLIARALCATTRLLILDEPVSGLDPSSAEELYSLIDKLHSENDITIIMVSHDVTSSLKHATKVLHLATGVKFFGEVHKSEVGE